MTEEKETIVSKLAKHWFLITAFAAITSAWGADHVKLATLEDALKAQVKVTEDVTKLKAESARVDERTLMMIKMMDEQRQMTQSILDGQQKMNRSIRSIAK